VRAANGTITDFNVPGIEQAVAQSINAAGIIAGYAFGTDFVSHGFVRAAGGLTTTFNAPGAGWGESEGTVGNSINDAGSIAGTYTDASFVYHGFVLTP
jgi:hypothetical protein